MLIPTHQCFTPTQNLLLDEQYPLPDFFFLFVGGSIQQEFQIKILQTSGRIFQNLKKIIQRLIICNIQYALNVQFTKSMLHC